MSSVEKAETRPRDEPMSEHNFALEGWNSFAKIVLPADCSTVQRTEMRRAFYAGIKLLLVAVYKLETQPAPVRLACLLELDSELSEFLKDVLEGRA